MAGELLRGIAGAIAKVKARAIPSPASVIPGRRAEPLVTVNCSACHFRFETDPRGDAGQPCCDFCARITCPMCRHVFFRAMPEHADKPMSFFRAHRFQHANHDH